MSALDGEKSPNQGLKSLPLRHGCDRFKDMLMDLGIANDSIFPNLLTSCLKLRLNQSHNLTLISQHTVQGRKNQTKGNELTSMLAKLGSCSKSVFSA